MIVPAADELHPETASRINLIAQAAGEVALFEQSDGTMYVSEQIITACQLVVGHLLPSSEASHHRTFRLVDCSSPDPILHQNCAESTSPLVESRLSPTNFSLQLAGFPEEYRDICLSSVEDIIQQRKQLLAEMESTQLSWRTKLSRLFHKAS